LLLILAAFYSDIVTWAVLFCLHENGTASSRPI